MSLRRRLLIGLVVVAVVLVATNVALSGTMQRFLLERVDTQLVDVASRPVFGRAGGRGPSAGAETLSEYFIAVGNPASGRMTHLTSAFADEDRPPPSLRREVVLANLARRGAEPEPFTAQAVEGGGEWRLVAVADPRGAAVIGVSLDEVQDTAARIRLVQVAGTLAVLAALGLVSWWVVRHGVHPVEDMARTADAIAGGDLSQRVEHPSEQTEAGRLGVALNAMLGRIEDAFRAREASEERVRRFAADASHELRTPLTSIRGYAELWRAGGLRDEAALSDAMRRMEQEASRMGALVEDLLLLARLDQRRPLERSTVRLDEVVADAVHDARAVEPARTITLDLHPAAVAGDEARLRQVVGNLLANALVHTPETAAVHVSVGPVDGGRVRLEVADEGPGMPGEVAEKVFERFYRADASRARAGGGTGLGLSIVAAVAEAHGGRATVTSTPGEGSSFVVDLPAAEGAAPARYARPVGSRSP